MTKLARNSSKKLSITSRTMTKAKLPASPIDEKYRYEIKAYAPPPGVVPEGSTAATMAADSASAPFNPYSFLATPSAYFVGFPGYQYLSMLAAKPEYRAFASTLSTECTREWIKFTSKQDDDDNTAEKIKQIEAEFLRLNVRDVFQRAVEHDSYFGCTHIFLDIQGADHKTPLIIDKRTIKPGSLVGVETVEPIWVTPTAYNALDPVAADFYKPNIWWMLGQQVHASRLMTIITRPLPDILKPAFNFGGISLSQLAEPYVDNWLRTRQSVADLVYNFSLTVLATSMDQVLQGTDDGTELFKRAELFNAAKANRGLMLLDKDREEVSQINTPLSGLSELQAQAQEHMCSVSRTPAIVLTGISPTGLNASSEGEIRVFYDWIAAQQNAFWRDPLETILKVVQLSLFGEIDDDIGIEFVPLYQMTEKELAEIRESDSRSATAYVTDNVLAPDEIRDKLAKDPNSGFMGLDTGRDLTPPADPTQTGEAPPNGLEHEDLQTSESAQDKSVSEKQHRAMEAAAHGNSTLGIPKKVGKEFVSKDRKPRKKK